MYAGNLPHIGLASGLALVAVSMMPACAAPSTSANSARKSDNECPQGIRIDNLSYDASSAVQVNGIEVSVRKGTAPGMEDESSRSIDLYFVKAVGEPLVDEDKLVTRLDDYASDNENFAAYIEDEEPISKEKLHEIHESEVSSKPGWAPDDAQSLRYPDECLIGSGMDCSKVGEEYWTVVTYFVEPSGYYVKEKDYIDFKEVYLCPDSTEQSE